MQEFMQMAVQKLGLPEETVHSATGAILRLIRENGESEDTRQLMGALPGAARLFETKPAATGTQAGGLLGAVAKQGASALGARLGPAAGLAGALSGSGLEASHVAPFVSLFMGFVKQKAGADLVARVLGKIPDLQKLVG